MANQRLRNILRHREPEYPQVSEPIRTESGMFRGHVKVSKSIGNYLIPEFDSESKAAEFSAEFVINVRENGNNK